MYGLRQLQVLKDSGDRGPNKCKFPFDGVGRLYNLKEEEKPLWERVVKHFLLLGKNTEIFYDERIRRYFCTIYLYRRDCCNEYCPGHISVGGISTKKTMSGVEEKKDEKK